ncbi:META domain-containing protein [Polaribacter sp. R2A056_3_33]|uniref:META domain-containing protein n=1 Tax=unclassified Polaribacter TaxID=196858 RepID=UPI001C4EED37|nr:MULTISPECIES: META domain-containing protein [unclassified Polaribacter]QXP63529.1 META domain-containing protein [Polaribacter sp. HaHaR_3_91]QXP71525.1 META domain-containing protein [Polaribacter sp. R2A056_3_33]
MKTKILFLILILPTITNCKSTSVTNHDDTITEKYWKLKTLYGNEIKMEDNQKREIAITLKTKDNRFSGFAGCNSINGEYILEKGNKIKFTKVISTRMFCNNTDESKLLKAINSTDNYTIKNNRLSLNVGKRAPLAVFEAVYMN